MLGVGATVPINLELVFSDSTTHSVGSLLRGPDYVLLIFIHILFEAEIGSNMETLISSINKNLGFFTSRNVRVAIVCKETPSAMVEWINSLHLELEVFSDFDGLLTENLVGYLDFTKFLFDNKQVKLGGQVVVPNPGFVLVGSDAKIRKKMILSDPKKIEISVKDVEKFAGLSI